MKLLILFFLFPISAFADVTDHYDKITAAFSIETPGFNFNLEPIDETINSKIEYEPNLRALVGVQGSWKWITLWYKTSGSYDEKQLFEKGKTSFDDVRGGLFIGKKSEYFLYGYYNRYKGFYIKNTKDIDPTWADGDPLLQRRDIENFNLGGQLLFIRYPDKFSAASFINQTSQQTASGGSVLYLASYDSSLFQSESPFVPNSVSADYGSDSSMNYIRVSSGTMSVGYGQTWVYNHLFLTLYGLIGYGIQIQKYKLATDDNRERIGTGKITLSGSFGYNGEKYFSGFYLNLDSNNYKTNSIQLNSTLAIARLYVGTRF